MWKPRLKAIHYHSHFTEVETKVPIIWQVLEWELELRLIQAPGVTTTDVFLWEASILNLCMGHEFEVLPPGCSLRDESVSIAVVGQTSLPIFCGV